MARRPAPAGGVESGRLAPRVEGTRGASAPHSPSVADSPRESETHSGNRRGGRADNAGVALEPLETKKALGPRGPQGLPVGCLRSSATDRTPEIPPGGAKVPEP